jgi:hypothetical protein
MVSINVIIWSIWVSINYIMNNISLSFALLQHVMLLSYNLLLSFQLKPLCLSLHLNVNFTRKGSEFCICSIYISNDLVYYVLCFFLVIRCVCLCLFCGASLRHLNLSIQPRLTLFFFSHSLTLSLYFLRTTPLNYAQLDPSSEEPDLPATWPRSVSSSTTFPDVLLSETLRAPLRR